MNIPDKHLALLHSIESVIINTYRQDSSLKDTQVRKALGGLIKKYRALATGKIVLDFSSSSKVDQILFENIDAVLEKKRSSTGISSSQKPKSLFGRRNRQESDDEIFLACLRRIDKSVDRWSKRGGEQGYLNYIQVYLK